MMIEGYDQTIKEIENIVQNGGDLINWQMK